MNTPTSVKSFALTAISVAVAALLLLTSCMTAQPATVINNYYYEIHVDSPMTQDTTFTVMTPQGQVEPVIVVEPTPVQQDVWTESLPQAEAQPESQPQPEPQLQQEVAQEPVPERLFMEIGATGPAGGTVFHVDDICYEMAQPVYETLSYDDAASKCDVFESNGYTDWKMPTIGQLSAIYTQLYDSFLIEIEENYYWSGDVKDDDSAYVMYFGTGFESAFFKDMDFLSLIPVRAL